MRLTLIPLLAIVSAAPGVLQPRPDRTTRTFREVTQEVAELPDAAVRDASVSKYLAALTFPNRGNGDVADVKQCHACADNVRLEISSEMGTTGLRDANMAEGGRIVARVRNVDWHFWRHQRDLSLGFHDEAYLWVSGRLRSPGVYEAALIHLDASSGARHERVSGRVWYCPNPDGQTLPSGDAKWVPPHRCSEPLVPGHARTGNFHLTSWFACDQGCCIFADDPE